MSSISDIGVCILSITYTMWRISLCIFVVVGRLIEAQQQGRNTPEQTLDISFETCTSGGGCQQQRGGITIDGNWRWTHKVPRSTLKRDVVYHAHELLIDVITIINLTSGYYSFFRLMITKTVTLETRGITAFAPTQKRAPKIVLLMV